MIFKSPWILFLIPIVLISLFFLRRFQKPTAFRFPSVQLVSSLKKNWKTRFKELPFYLRLIAILFLMIALAGPRLVSEMTKQKKEGIDIVLAIDASRSMLAEDFTIGSGRYNRLEVVKRVVKDFVDARVNDRLGLVAFAGAAYTVSPMTTDHEWFKTNLDRIHFDLFDEEGTAIGSAVMASLTRLKKSQAKSKVIILLTDGVNNAGKTEPIAAAKAAHALGVRIYTIGAGVRGYAPYPVQDFFGNIIYKRMKVDVDEETLKRMADLTSGRFFRATDTASLEQVYREIDSLEKIEIEEQGYKHYEEQFMPFLIIGLIFLGLELILANTFFMRIP
ncbi:MAG: VWA domain-containing protein [Candidatus Omnitrophica bacterium]|nr:VWA domain-containing protein [Candidatus Omnitrophota bacterium]